MGAVDIERQAPNVFRRLLGAGGARGNRIVDLKDAMNGTLRDWVAHVDDTFYVMAGSRPASLPENGSRFPVGHRQ